MLLSNKVYDVIKWIARYLLPFTGSCFALVTVMGLQYGVKIIGAIFALILFLSMLLDLSSRTYLKSGANTDGTLQIDVRDIEKDIYRLQLNSDIEDLADKKRITLIVDPNAKLSD